jgi:integrase
MHQSATSYSLPMPTPPRTLTHAGETLSLKQWSQRTGIAIQTIRSRLDHLKWDAAKALSTPADTQRARRGPPPVPAPRPCPALRHHKTKNLAYVRWQAAGKDNFAYLGPWGSQEAADAYRRFQIEWASRVIAPEQSRDAAVFICELVADYLVHVGRYYVKDGKPTSEQNVQRAALRVLLEMYPRLSVSEFRPRHLKAIQAAMVAKGWVRTTVNKYLSRLKCCFSWGVAEELVPASVADALAHVPHLQAGRTKAPDLDPVMAVATSAVEATLPYLDRNPQRRGVLEAMIRFQLLTGCRPGELCAMTAAAVDTSAEVWVYRVTDKNTHRQVQRRPRLVWIGPQAQAILRPFLANPGPGGRIWCFPPRFPESPKARRVPISRGLYGECIRLASAAAGVETWTPHQLRHNRATEIQRLYESNKAASIAIGDTEEVTRAVYVDPNEAVARRIALATG